MTTLVSFPDRSLILIDRSPFGGFEVEPYMCPAASGKGRWFRTFAEAHGYAEAVALAAGTSVFLVCSTPEGDAA